MKREIQITIEVDLGRSTGPEEDDPDVWTDLAVSLAAELEDLGCGEVEGNESLDRQFTITAYTTRGHWNAALTIVIEALRRRDLMHAAVIRKTELGPNGNGGTDDVVWPVRRRARDEPPTPSE